MTYRLVALFALFSVAGVPDTGDALTGVFGRIDAAAKTFKGMTSAIKNTEYHQLVNESDVETGTFAMLRAKDGTHMLAQLSGDSGTQSISIDAHNLRVYNPKTRIVDEWDISGKQVLVNQFLLLGFGATSADLKANYDVSYAGTEKINNQQTSRIALTPKAADVRRELKQADLWIADGGPYSGIVVQQKFLRPSGDYRLVEYSNMKLGAPAESDVKLKTAGSTTTQKH